MRALPGVLGMMVIAVWHASAAVANLFPVEDTTISEGNLAHTTFSGDLIVGRLGPNGGDSKCRALLRFDLTSIPTNATITSATLTVNVWRNHLGGSDVHKLNRLSSPWTEEDATWTTSGLAAWDGGAFEEDSDSTVAMGLDLATFPSTPAMVASAQLWLTDPTMNNGWLLWSGDEITSANARRISAREAFSGQPLLTIKYSVPPPADFVVTSPGFSFDINGQNPNPELTLTRGSNYIFAINTDSIHPFEIVSDLAGTPYTNGLSTNDISNGIIAFAVPENAPDTLFYICSQHFFGGTIQVVNPPPSPDFTVTTPGSYYVFNGGDPNPTLTLTRGVTYTFAIDADSSHPFEIVSDLIGTPWEEGIVNNNISSGLLTFTVPPEAPDLLYYICSLHFFGGEINIIDPPPFLARILSLDVGASNVVMKSLGTNGNGWLAIPEYTSNLLVSNWTAVPAFSNSFLNGTNVTAFNRLDPICGPNVFLRMKNVKN